MTEVTTSGSGAPEARRLFVNLSARVAAQVDHLKDYLGADSEAEVIRRAVALMEEMVRVQEAGGSVGMVNANGDSTVVRFA